MSNSKPSLFNGIGVLVSCVALSVVLNADAGVTWTNSSPVYVKHAVNLAGFQNGQFGVTVGYAGEIHYSTDSGQTWPRGTNSSWCRFGLDIVSDKIVWNCGNAGHVRVTKDGGATWQAVTDFGLYEPNHCRYISFLDDKTGWIAGPAKLGSTSDGGVKWTDKALPTGIQTIVAMTLRTALDGYVLDSAGSLFITTDGGATWTTRSVGALVRDSMTLLPGSAPAAAIRFTDQDHGLIVLSLMLNKTVRLLAMRTSDGGQTWTDETIADASGVVYFNRDGSLLTTYLNKKILVYSAQTTGVSETQGAKPKGFSLSQNYPNPFNSMTRIRFSLPVRQETNIRVYDSIGKQVGTAFHGVENAGNHEILFIADGLPSGFYFYKLETVDATVTKRFLLIK